MIVVTGAAGFIGKNYIKLLNDKGITDIIAVDVKEPTDVVYAEFVHRDELMAYLHLCNSDITSIVHLGATTNTMASKDECFHNNYIYTSLLLETAKGYGLEVIYASSAAVYGNSGKPLNYYGYSKLAIDKINTASVGLRFFNVYGDGEEHKGDMKSFVSRIKEGYDKLFEGTEEHRRDFVEVTDVCEVIEFFRLNFRPGIYDVGTGTNVSFKELFELFGVAYELIPMPEHLVGKLQENTLADLTGLRDVGYTREFIKLKE